MHDNQSILIKNGQVITDGRSMPADILVEDGRIARLGPHIEDSSAMIIDASDKLVFPGFIDAHTHLDMDTGTAVTADDFRSGTKAAAMGGTTTIIDFATQDRGGTLTQALQAWHDKADNRSHCNYAFHMAITDWNEHTRSEMANMFEQGVSSYKVYMAYDNLRLSDGNIYEIIREAGRLGCVVGCHCENGDLVNELVAEQISAGNTGPAGHPLSRPDYVEAEAISRFLTLSHAAGYPVVIVHLSSEAGYEIAKNQRRNGMKFYLETCPQYLLLDDDSYALPDFEGAKYVISPPLRSSWNNNRLWSAVKYDDIDTIATDHCCFNFHGQKDIGIFDFSKIPNGAPGLQTRPALIYTNMPKLGIGDVQFCRLLSENPARLYGMYPQKGSLRVGSDADIVVWDKDAEDVISVQNQLSACDYTPYEGFATKGKAAYVLVNGNLVVNDGEFVGDTCGKYIHRGPSQFWR